MTGKLQLYIYERCGVQPDSSPFGVKLETFLRAAKIQYEPVFFPEHQMKTAPKGKCPYVLRSDLNGGKHLGDSSIIMKALVENGDSPDFDSWLSETQKATALAIKALLEDSIYWYDLWTKFASDQYWKVSYPIVFKDAPALVARILGFMLRRQTIGQAYAQGTGRHSEAELIAFATEKLKAVSTLLGDNKYMMGDRLCSLDFTAFAVLSSIAAEPWTHPINDIVRSDKRLAAYVERMRGEFFPDFVASAN